MSQVNGTVQKIQERPAGSGVAYNINVNGQWYGHGFAKPKFSEGDNISFTYTQNGRFMNIDVRSIQISAGASAPAKGGGGKSGGYQSPQLAIQYQASRNSAIALVDILLKSAAVPLPTKKADQYEAVLALVEELTNTFHTKTDKVVENGGVYDSELESRLAGQGDFE